MVFNRTSPEPTIQLIELLIRRYGNLPPLKVLDLCCGSGWIARRLREAWPDTEFWASDISGPEIDVAEAIEENAGIHFIQSDLFNSIEFDGIKFDLIIADPPYVPTEYVLPHDEPVIAFDGGEDGYDTVKRIALDAPNYLKAGGVIAIEKWHEFHPCLLGWEVVKDRAGFSRFALWYTGQ